MAVHCTFRCLLRDKNILTNTLIVRHHKAKAFGLLIRTYHTPDSALYDFNNHTFLTLPISGIAREQFHKYRIGMHGTIHIFARNKNIPLNFFAFHKAEFVRSTAKYACYCNCFLFFTLLTHILYPQNRMRNTHSLQLALLQRKKLPFREPCNIFLIHNICYELKNTPAHFAGVSIILTLEQRHIEKD